MWMNSNQPSNSVPSLGKWSNGQFQNNQSYRSFGTSAGSVALSTQQKALVTEVKNKSDLKEKLAAASQSPGHRGLSRTTSSGVYTMGVSRPSALSSLNQHRALQRSSSFDPVRMTPNLPPALSLRPSGLSPSTSPSQLGMGNATNGCRSRETGLVEKLLASYGFIKCADREGRLFFHYSQFHGEAGNLNLNDEVEFDVSMDTRTGKPVAVQVVKLKKGTVVFELYSKERILGEITNPVFQGLPGVSSPMNGTSVNGAKGDEKGEPGSIPKFGSLCYDRNGEIFFLSYSVNDLANKAIQLQARDQVSFYLATEKRTQVTRPRQITLVERAPPQRFTGIVTALKESFGFIERGDVVKEIFFHYSEVNATVPDLHIGDHVEYSIQDRNGKEVAAGVRLLPPGSVQLEEFSDEVFTGTVEKPLPPKAPNKLQHPQISNAAGDAATVGKINGGAAVLPQQPSVTLAGVIQYMTPQGKSRKIHFGEKDRAANCSYTLRQGDQVSFFTVTDKRNSHQRAAGVTLLLRESLELSKEKREWGIVAAVKEGFGFIKCLERDSRLFFHCCELLDSNYNVRMSDEVEFTVLNDPVAEKHRLHATRITILPKGTVVFHTVSDKTYVGTVELLPGNPTSVEPDCLISPALGPNPGFIVYEDEDKPAKIPFTFKEFAEWTEATELAVGGRVSFQIGTVKRTGAKNAVNIKLSGPGAARTPEKSTQEVVKDIVSGLQLMDVSTASSLSQGSPTLSDHVFSTPEACERTPIVAQTNIVGVIDEISLPPMPFGSSSGPARSRSNAESLKLTSPRPPNRNIRDRSPSSSSDGKAKSPRAVVQSEKLLGWISTLKETFGFIETADHSAEIFFHFSEFQDSQEKFNVNTPITYFKGVKEDKPCAMFVSIAREKDLVQEDMDPTIYEGKITKPPKSGGQPAYQGIITYKDGKEIRLSPLSMTDRRDFIQNGDVVTFQICTNLENGQTRAVNVAVKREVVQATVESVKGEYGFINYEVKNADAANACKLFFHMSEVREGADELSTGTLVDFSVVYNQRTGKYSAINVRCLESKRRRPERLRLRSSCCEVSGPTVVATRQPKGPTGDKGFALKRSTGSEDGDEKQSEPASD